VWLTEATLNLPGTDEMIFSLFGYSSVTPPTGYTGTLLVPPTIAPTLSASPSSSAAVTGQNLNGGGGASLSQGSLIGIVLGVLGGITVLVVVVILVVVFVFLKRAKPQDQVLVLNNNTGRLLTSTSADQIKRPGYEHLPFATPPIGSPSGSKEPYPNALQMESYEIDYSELEFEQEIGRGAYGVVFKGTWRGGVVAIKQLNLMGTLTQKELNDFRVEAGVMKSLRPHVNVVQFLGITSSPTLCIVTEFLDQGSLYHLVFSNAKIDSNLLMNVVKGIAAGMLHLHREGIVHRDLATRNILLGSGNQVKISDFGLSRVATNDASTSNHTRSDTGPLKWMSPEAIRNREYSRSSDVWAFGVTLYEFVSRSEPYMGLDPVQAALQVTHSGLRLQIPSYTPMVLAEVMRGCFEYDPQRRPDFQYISKRMQEAKMEDWLIRG